MTVLILLAILIFGLVGLFFAFQWSVKHYGRESLPWTKEAKALKRAKKEEDIRAMLEKAMGLHHKAMQWEMEEWDKFFKEENK
jgi:hypothetical protein